MTVKNVKAAQNDRNIHGHTLTHAVLHWSQLSCWYWRHLPAAVSDVGSNRLCFTTCHSFNTRRSARNNYGDEGGLRLCSPFIRSVRWWITAEQRWGRWCFIAVLLRAVDTQQSLISPLHSHLFSSGKLAKKSCAWQQKWKHLIGLLLLHSWQHSVSAAVYFGNYYDYIKWLRDVH